MGLASIELSFHPCNLLRDNCRGVSRQSRGNKNVGCGTWKLRFFCNCGSNNWETVEEMGTYCEGFGKHWIVFSFMQRFAWLLQGRPQGKQKMKAGYVKMAIFTARCYALPRYMPSCGVCLSVCLSVTFVDHVKTNKHIRNFRPISCFIFEMLQQRAIVTM